MRPNPDQPDRCPSIDPDDTLQCTRRIHEDDQCRSGGIAWKKGTPRHVSAKERVSVVLDICAQVEANPVGWGGDTAVSLARTVRKALTDPNPTKKG